MPTIVLLFSCLMMKSIGTSPSMSISSWSSEDVIVNINKGYALRRVGIYSPEVIEEIVHTFIPLNNLCTASPETSVCLYASLKTKKAIVSLGTIMATHPSQILPTYSTERISTLITQDIHRVLTQYNPGRIVLSSKSIIHFVNNQFHYKKAETNAMALKATNNYVENYSDINRVSPNLAEKIRQQINSNKVGLQYLSETDLKSFLIAVFSIIDSTHSVSNVERSLNTFSQLIVGQNVFGLRSCSLDQKNTALSEPCLVISTLFLRSPLDTRAKFSIYRLVALPVVLNGEMYVYTQLPNIIGINALEEKVIVWNEDTKDEECSFSELVRCRSVPISFPLTRASCVSQLLNNNQANTDMCEVRKTLNIQEDAMRIDDGIWLFHNAPNIQHCAVYSSSTDLTEPISIVEPTIINTSCNKTIACADFELPATPCSERQLTLLPQPPPHARSRSRFFPSLKTMTNTIITAYNLQSNKSIRNIKQTINEQKHFLIRLFDDSIAYVGTTLSLILLLLFICILRIVKRKLREKLNTLESIIEDILINKS